MVKLSEFYRKAKNILEKSGIESCDFDTRCIIEDVLGMSFARLIIYDKYISQQHQEIMTDMIKKRSSGYPLQYILGEWEFYGLPFIVGEGVLIPRPDTETLVDKVLEYAGKHENLKIADLCSGSGCIATAIEKNTVNSDVYAVEISDIAYKYLEKNIELNSSSVKPYKADVLRYETAEKFRDFDVIVSNPPYLTEDDMKHLQKEVSYEPEMALYGNSDGLEFYRRIPEIWYNSLKHGGMMAFEVGMGQAQDVAEILKENGFKDIKAVNDLSGIARAVYGRKF